MLWAGQFTSSSSVSGRSRRSQEDGVSYCCSERQGLKTNAIQKQAMSWLIFSFPLYFIASAMRVHRTGETRVSPIAQTKAAWLGFLSLTTIYLAVWWEFWEGHPRVQGTMVPFHTPLVVLVHGEVWSGNARVEFCYKTTKLEGAPQMSSHGSWPVSPEVQLKPLQITIYWNLYRVNTGSSAPTVSLQVEAFFENSAVK